jgi:hypothetical protein
MRGAMIFFEVLSVTCAGGHTACRQSHYFARTAVVGRCMSTSGEAELILRYAKAGNVDGMATGL